MGSWPASKRRVELKRNFPSFSVGMHWYSFCIIFSQSTLFRRVSMNVSSLFQNRLTGKTIDLLSKALDFGSANHNVISGNLSNIDTPGYRPKKAVFDENLRQAVEQRAVRLRTTNRNHFSHLSSTPHKGEAPYSIHTTERKGAKGSALDIDNEMATMVQNNLFYQTSAQLLSKKFESIKLAIQGGK